MLKKMPIIFILAVFINNAFASNEITNIFNLPTAQTTGSNIFLFDVGHRYLDVNRHTTNINMTIGYGFTDWFDIYAGFAFKNKDVLASTKINILNDFSMNNIFSLALFLGGGYKDTAEVNNSVSLTYADKNALEAKTVIKDSDRPSYFGQIILEKHLLGNRWSIAIVPTYAGNTNFYGIKSKDDFSAGCGFSTEIFIFDRVAIAGETIINIYGFALKYANYNVGIKYAGYRHTFAIWIGNSAGYSPVEYIIGNSDTTPKISFNFTREFDM